jgi:hypothetical protein
MAKSIKNKVYNEFWEDDNLDVKKTESKKESNLSSDEIKKLERKLSKKVSGLEKEIKEIKGENENSTEDIKPVNPPRGWHARNEFIDEVGNKFEKGVYIGNVKEVKEDLKIEEPKDEEKECVERVKKSIKSDDFKEKIQKSAEKIIPNPIIKNTQDIKIIEPKIITNKDIYQQYIDDNIPFKIFFRGNLIFDSKVHPLKNYPNFQNDGFILFGKNYIYRGIRIEKY